MQNQNNVYLDLRDDPVKGIVIANVTETRVESGEQIMNLLYTGNKRRTTESTNINLTSSPAIMRTNFEICSRILRRGLSSAKILQELSSAATNLRGFLVVFIIHDLI